jgi:hypothetical protein
MAGTQIWKASRIRAAGGRASLVSGGSTRGRRAGLRLWTLLNAQALINGTTGTPDDVAFIEDDRWRMRAAGELPRR